MEETIDIVREVISSFFLAQFFLFAVFGLCMTGIFYAGDGSAG